MWSILVICVICASPCPIIHGWNLIFSSASDCSRLTAIANKVCSDSTWAVESELKFQAPAPGIKIFWFRLLHRKSSIGGFPFVHGGSTYKFDKNSTDLQCFIFQFGRCLELSLGAAKPSWRRDCSNM